MHWPEWHNTDSWTSPQVLIFLLLLAGFAIKVPMFPFHTWLPLAHVEAPTAGSILLAGVLLKVGTYGLLRFNVGMTPLAAARLFPLMATMAIVGIIYGALAALAQTDIKRLVAYSSVSHMGFIVLGIFALNATSLDGSAIQMINHGLSTGALFACVGMIYERYHTRDMTQLGGLWNRLPILAFFFITSALASAAVPGLNGFVGEFPILAGTFQKSGRAAVFAATGMVLGACYLLWVLRAVVFGPLREPAHDAASGETTGPGDHATNHPPIAPIGWHEVAGMTPILSLIVLIGVYPRPFLDQIRPAMGRLDRNTQAQLERATTERQAATEREGFAQAFRKGGGGSSKKKGSAPAKSTTKSTTGKGKGKSKTAKPAEKSSPTPAKETPTSQSQTAKPAEKSTSAPAKETATSQSQTAKPAEKSTSAPAKETPKP